MPSSQHLRRRPSSPTPAASGRDGEAPRRARRRELLARGRGSKRSGVGGTAWKRSANAAASAGRRAGPAGTRRTSRNDRRDADALAEVARVVDEAASAAAFFRRAFGGLRSAMVLRRRRRRRFGLAPPHLGRRRPPWRRVEAREDVAAGLVPAAAAPRAALPRSPAPSPATRRRGPSTLHDLHAVARASMARGAASVTPGHSSTCATGTRGRDRSTGRARTPTSTWARSSRASSATASERISAA